MISNKHETAGVPARKKNIPPIVFGVVLALITVIIELMNSRLDAPQAYAFCMVCHPRDLLQRIIPLEMEAPEYTRDILILTVPGIFLGSFIAARRYREFKVMKSSNPFAMVFLGLLTAFAGLSLMSCPTRLWLRLGFGDPMALIAILGVTLGIFVAVRIQRWWACRS